MLNLYFLKSFVRNLTCGLGNRCWGWFWLLLLLLFLLVLIIHHWFIWFKVSTNSIIDRLFSKSIVVRSFYFDHVLHFGKIYLICSYLLLLHWCRLFDIAAGNNAHTVIFEILFWNPSSLHVFLLLLAPLSAVRLEVILLCAQRNLLRLRNLTDHRETSSWFRRGLACGSLGTR